MITQELLDQLRIANEAKRFATKNYDACRQAVLDAHAADAKIEPGKLSVDIFKVDSKRSTQPALKAYFGDAAVTAYLAQLKATVSSTTVRLVDAETNKPLFESDYDREKEGK